MKTYLIDVVVRTVIRVEATDRKTALDTLRRELDCAEANFGAFPDGSPIVGEASWDELRGVEEVDESLTAAEKLTSGSLS